MYRLAISDDYIQEIVSREISDYDTVIVNYATFIFSKRL